MNAGSGRAQAATQDASFPGEEMNIALRITRHLTHLGLLIPWLNIQSYFLLPQQVAHLCMPQPQNSCLCILSVPLLTCLTVSPLSSQPLICIALTGLTPRCAWMYIGWGGAWWHTSVNQDTNQSRLIEKAVLLIEWRCV